MFPQPRHGWIGIDVGATTLKLAQLARRSGRLELIASATVARANGGEGGQSLRDQDGHSLRNDLETVLAVAGQLQGKRTAAALPIDACRLEPGRGPTAVGAVEEPDSEDAWSWASWPTGVESSDPEAGWYTIAARAEDADALANGLLEAGLSCRTIDGGPMAIARAIGMVAADRPADCIAAIDWGWGSARLVSVVSGYPVYVRTLRRCGLGAAVELVAEELGVSPSEAGEALQRRPPATPGAEAPQDRVACELSALVRPVFDQLGVEVRRTLAHLRSHRPQAAPAELCLIGGGASLPGAAPWIGGVTGLPTRVWRPPGAGDDAQNWPVLGSAIALSALAWEAR